MNDKKKQLYLDFEAYERVAEPHKREKAEAWRAAIGLQDVDGLVTLMTEDKKQIREKRVLMQHFNFWQHRISR